MMNKGNNMTDQLTVGRLIEMLSKIDPNMPVAIAMREEYQSTVTENMVAVEIQDDYSEVLVIDDCR